MKLYTIIAGLNGTGKSSFTGSLKYQRSDLGIIVDADRIAVEEFGGDTYEAGKAAVERLENAIRDGVNFTQETTLSGSYPRKLAKAAREQGYTVRMFYIGVDTLEETKRRIRNRVQMGGHDIREAYVERRFDRRFSSLKKILPYCDTAIFFDNWNGFREVGEYRNGELIAYGGKIPKWFLALKEHI